MVDLDELAASVPGNMSRNWLKAALQKLVRHGYLVETRRDGGGRGNGAKRSHDLVAQPAKPASAQGRDNEETRHAGGAGIEETRLSGEINPPLHDDKPAPVEGSYVASDLGEQPPLGTSIGTSGGTDRPEASSTPEPDTFGDDPPEGQSTDDEPRPPAAARAAPPDRIAALPLPPIHWPADYPDPEPPARCPKHADHDGWVQEPCRLCAAADKAHKAWEANRAQWRKDRATAIQAWIGACNQCDEEGWTKDDPEDELPALKCPHAPNLGAWSTLHPTWRQEYPATTEQRRAS